MKKIGLIIITITLITIVFTACEKSELSSDYAIEGTYIGTLTSIEDLTARAKQNANAEITKIGNRTIQVHLFNVALDTTFMLNYYGDMNHVRVCFTGENFENMYGHMLGQGHSNGGMMGDMQNGETEWTHHLNDEHQEDDEHFGSFDMQNHTFTYSFKTTEDGITYNMLFNGEKVEN